MELSASDRRLLAKAAEGLPLVPRPFAALGRAAGLSETDALARLAALQSAGAVKRLGLIVRHRELGYRANAMVAWDIPDGDVDAVGARMSGFPFVTLCYRRRRAPPQWPYNLFAMIHGTERAAVLKQIGDLNRQLELEAKPQAVLFSRRRFKQRGARYSASEASWTSSTAAS
jgi:DNA-binding Lrp family transcriptional regulator